MAEHHSVIAAGLPLEAMDSPLPGRRFVPEIPEGCNGNPNGREQPEKRPGLEAPVTDDHRCAGDKTDRQRPQQLAPKPATVGFLPARENTRPHQQACCHRQRAEREVEKWLTDRQPAHFQIIQNQWVKCADGNQQGGGHQQDIIEKQEDFAGQ